jgi:hypothetical protein
VRLVFDGPVVAEAEPPAEAAQRLQFRPVEPSHLPHQARHVAGEDLADHPMPALGQRDGDEPAVVVAPLLGDEVAANQVGHDHGGVAVTAQQLVSEIALAQRAVVQQRL